MYPHVNAPRTQVHIHENRTSEPDVVVQALNLSTREAGTDRSL